MFRKRAGNFFLPANSASMAFTTTLAWLFAEKADFGIFFATEASPSTWTSLTRRDSKVSGTIGHQSPLAQPALCAMSPARCAGTILATAALIRLPSPAITSIELRHHLLDAAACHLGREPLDDFAVVLLPAFLEQGHLRELGLGIEDQKLRARFVSI